MVQQILLNRLIRQLGPTGRLVREMMRENAELERRVKQLEKELTVQRTLKRRSPADWRFRVLRWEEGEQTFQPRGEPVPKTVPNLRLHIHRDDPSEGAPYWDITSLKLQAALRPILPYLVETGAYVHIVKDGDGVGSVYSMSVEPAQPS
ncbi:MAG: hypothetical protein V3S00_01805 [Dehalococcoidia bacterium]